MSDTPEDTSPYVGTAYMQPNGTLELRLRAETDDGLVGEAMVVYAPVGEELMFRGFLYRGWARTPQAVLPAILAISTIWAGVHVQYDWFGMLQILIIGLILGWVRSRSGSTLLTMLLHGLVNAWATVETVVVVNAMN